MDVAGVSALVTGGASGLGLATARSLATAGAVVTIVDLPSSGGAEVASSIGGYFAPADVADSEQVAKAVAAATEHGPLRVVVNCAGIAPSSTVLDEDGAIRPRYFEKVVRVNLMGTYNVTAYGAAAMRLIETDADQTRGVIVNTASVAAFDGQIGHTAYAASKGGVHAMTLPLARELARYGVRVVTVAPGMMETQMFERLPSRTQDLLIQEIPFPARLGRAHEFAALVRHIVENEYLNGETIRLDGAIRLSPAPVR
ncbi:SDR family NAD(P)-dependent oxidoreductase [Rhodococcus sp. 14C212]|uniref:SDR family NAD(P)-dependent oxidoreductase n=1 Tax=Rhodococcus sp. 14C212 TaxID=2711209 RepID=UPI0013ED8EB0|nr:SDR family NAD(P)-dependent oxidoreductase [Rhodococcus sp. 14C212]